MLWILWLDSRLKHKHHVSQGIIEGLVNYNQVSGSCAIEANCNLWLQIDFNHGLFFTHLVRN